MFSTFSLNRLLALVVAAGFVFLTADSVIEHWAIFVQEPMAYIPVVFSAFGSIVGTLAVVQWKEQSIRRLHVTLYAAFVIAFGGLYFHVAEDWMEERTTEQREHEKKEKDKPLLAPLSFAGLALIGLLGTSRKWPAEVI